MDRKFLKENIKKEIIEWFFCFVVAYTIYLFINYFIGTISGVKQISMKPTANDGEKVLIQRTVFGKKDLKHGDIITFIAPSESVNKKVIEENKVLTGDEAVANYDEHLGIESFSFNFMGIGKKSYIKRVIGVAGDHIVISEYGKVYRNDDLIDEPYLKDGSTSRNGAYVDIIVPEETIFAMGDNRLQSMDSRSFGCIPISKIDGYVLSRVWPLNKIGNLK
ncbi:MAG: signal peptidase I [Clostridia bacterium]|nr:signal peptidase I [Clostridia bacterium]MDD4386535.1 signal peptidase I [Clostridia bacterium]